MHFTCQKNALGDKGELGRYSARRNQKLTRQCEQASGILHPCVPPFEMYKNETVVSYFVHFPHVLQ